MFCPHLFDDVIGRSCLGLTKRHQNYLKKYKGFECNCISFSKYLLYCCESNEEFIIKSVIKYTLIYTSLFCIDCQLYVYIYSDKLRKIFADLQIFFSIIPNDQYSKYRLFKSIKMSGVIALQCLKKTKLTNLILRKTTKVKLIIDLIHYMLEGIQYGRYDCIMPHKSTDLFQMLCQGILIPLLYSAKKKVFPYVYKFGILRILLSIYAQNRKSNSIIGQISLHIIQLLWQIACFKHQKYSYTIQLNESILLLLDDFRSEHMKMRMTFFFLKMAGKFCFNSKCKTTRGQVNRLYICKKCMVAKYCSRYCQKVHWNSEHRYQCNRL